MASCLDAIAKLFPFLLIGLAILTAAAFPWLACSYCDAPTHPEVTVWWGVNPGIFLVEGLTLPTGPMLRAAVRVREHAFIQLFNLLFMPLVLLLLSTWLAPWLPSGMREGLLAMAAVPTTTSMCVMHAGTAAGDAPLAAFSAVLGNTVAIIVSPAWLSFLCKADPEINIGSLLLSLTGKMLLPLLAGQVVQAMVMHDPHRCAVVIKVNQFLISCLLLQIFCDVFYHVGKLQASVVIETLALTACLHLSFLAISWAASAWLLHVGMASRVACLFSSTHKTVVLGLPMLREVFASRSPDALAWLAFPLICYHLLQLGIDLIIAQKLKPLVLADSSQRGDSSATASTEGEVPETAKEPLLGGAKAAP